MFHNTTCRANIFVSGGGFDQQMGFDSAFRFKRKVQVTLVTPAALYLKIYC